MIPPLLRPDRAPVGPSRRGATDRLGFTLLEIMMVVAILGILMAVGIPAFVKAIDKDPLQKAASDLTEALNTARAQAVLQGRPTEMVLTAEGSVSVDLAADRRELAAAGGEGAGSADPGAEVGALSGFPKQLGQDVAITSIRLNLRETMDAEEVRVRFYPNGTSDHLVLVLADASGVREIQVDEITGLAEMKSP